MIDEIILARLKNNDSLLVTLKITNLIYADLIELSNAVKNNTHLRDIEFEYDHLIHSRMTAADEIKIENMAKAIKAIVEKNKARYSSPRVINQSDRREIYQTRLMPVSTSTLLSSAQKQTLAINAAQAISINWTLSWVSARLSSQDIQFLNSYTLNDIAPEQESPFTLKKILIDLLARVLTSLVTSAVTNMLQSSSPAAQSLDKISTKPASADENIPVAASRSSHTFFSRPEPTTPSLGVERLPDFQLSPEFHYQASHSHLDPSLQWMEKAGLNAFKKIAERFTLFELNHLLIAGGKDASVNAAWNSLSLGSTANEAKQLYLSAEKATADFAKNVKNTLGAAVKTAIFYEKVETQGFYATVVDTAKDAFIQSAAKFTAGQLAKLFASSNPAFAGAVLATVIADVFKTTELAPFSHDMPPIYFHPDEPVFPRARPIHLETQSGPRVEPYQGNNSPQPTKSGGCTLL